MTVILIRCTRLSLPKVLIPLVRYHRDGLLHLVERFHLSPSDGRQRCVNPSDPGRASFYQPSYEQLLFLGGDANRDFV